MTFDEIIYLVMGLMMGVMGTAIAFHIQGLYLCK